MPKCLFLDYLDQYVLTYEDQLLTKLAKVIATIFVVQLSVIYIFPLKKDAVLFFLKVDNNN